MAPASKGFIPVDYVLDFTGQSGVPSQWGINVAQVVQWFHKQVGTMDEMQVLADRKRGVFNVTAYAKKSADFLSTFMLIAEKGGRRFELPLKPKQKRSEKAVWATLQWTCEGALAAVDNAAFDAFFKEKAPTSS